MSLLSKAKTSADVEDVKDTVGGYKPMASDIHHFTIEYAFVEETAKGAVGVTFKLSDGSETLISTQYIISGNEKGNKNTYEDRNKKTHYMPGFVIANDISQIVLGKDISDLDTESKQLLIYDYDEKKEVPKTKEVIMELVGTQISIGTIQKLEDKWNEPTKSRTVIECDKVFESESMLTLLEKEAGEVEGVFYTTWLDSNKDRVNDVRKKSLPGAAPAENPFTSEDEESTDTTDPFATNDEDVLS